MIHLMMIQIVPVYIYIFIPKISQLNSTEPTMKKRKYLHKICIPRMLSLRLLTLIQLYLSIGKKGITFKVEIIYFIL